jgi:thiol-disulfide isomerase/thioredoxin
MRELYRRVAVAGLAMCGAVALSNLPGVARGQEKKADAVPAATVAGEAKPGKRTAEQIRADLDVQTKKLREALTSPSDLFEAEKRKTSAAKIVPPMKAIVAGFEEMMEADPAVRGFIAPARMQYLSMLALFDDAESVAKLAKMAESKDAGEATTAKGAQLLVRWWKNPKNAAEQSKVLDDTQALAKAHPESDELAMTVMMMSQQHAATPELQKRAQQILLEDLKSESAKELTKQVEAQQKLEGLEGKQLTIAGAKHEGGTLSTADWKGKVILVDFWATWCGPCIAELPRVKKVYADYHDKGLEILGVSCDNEAENLTAFLEKNKDMPWPHLFDPKTPGWHPLATEFGITGIPTMFLIDKKGVVRSVKARENFEEMIPKLLEEKEE